MKKEIVRVNDRYAVRYKRWYHLRWRYIGHNYIWFKYDLHKDFITCRTYEESKNKLDRFFPNIQSL